MFYQNTKYKNEHLQKLINTSTQNSIQKHIEYYKKEEKCELFQEFYNSLNSNYLEKLLKK